MRCSKCGADNREGARFCDKCGAKLPPTCASCGAENRKGAKFCDSCGAAFGADAAVGALAEAQANDSPIRVTETFAAENVEGERKTVTALFADIKGSMELIENLDPEEARAIVDPALKLMIDTVQRYGGYVAQSTGDGIFALFGAPVAYEDHPQRALYAALRMQEELRRYSDQLRENGRAPVSIRVGANAGEVVVRSIQTGQAHTEYVPIGHATSLAARLQALAAPGSIAISDAVRKLVEGYFALKALGPARIKGVSEPVDVHEVTGLGPLRTRLQRSAARGLFRFVGRETEIGQMKRALEQAKGGRGQVVAAIAEPGVGKSRLFLEFKSVVQSGCMVLEALSISHGKASAYLPVFELLHAYFKITHEDDLRTRRAKVAGKMAMLDRALEDTRPYLFSLLGIAEDVDSLAGMDARIKRARSLDALKRILLRESLNQPLIVIFEDLHWIDEETQALLNLLADSIATSKILLLVSYRPEYHHQWGSKTYYTQLRLDPLGKDSAEELLSAILGDGVEFGPLKRLIIEKTEGNPFFMEEAVQALFDEGALIRNGTVRFTRSLNQLKIPPTVQAILASRIDKLPPDEKELLQTLAVIGREFSFGLLKSVVAKADDELNRMLNDLQLCEFVYEQPSTGELEFVFKHALTQEVAANSMLLDRRKMLHARTAEAIETLYADRIDEHINELAHHYGQSANIAQAAHYLRRAGMQAMDQSAYGSAEIHLSSGLGLLSKLPESAHRDALEVKLQLAMGNLQLASKGYGAEEPETAFRRAEELMDRLGESAGRFEAELGLIGIHQIRGEIRTTLKPIERLFDLAAGDSEKIVAAHSMMGRSLFWAGELTPSRKHVESAILLLDAAPKALRKNNRSYPESSLSQCWTYSAWTLWYLGYPDQAVEKIQHTLRIGRRNPRSEVLATALCHAARLRLMRREVQLVLELAQEASELATAQGFPSWIAESAMIRGWALVFAGREAEGVQLVLSGLAAEKKIHDPGWYLGGWPAEACAKAGRIREAFELLEDLLKPGHEVYVFEADLHRVKGELLLANDPSNFKEAENSFRVAIDLADRCNLKSLSLSATTSLARSLVTQGRRDEARASLADIYSWFTEGFDTADLKDAKALLDQLNKKPD